jgi:hypothetical protein
VQSGDGGFPVGGCEQGDAVADAGAMVMKRLVKSSRCSQLPQSTSRPVPASRGWMPYFQPWLIGQGRKWFERAARDPNNLADVPGVRVLSGRWSREWSDGEWPQWEELSYVAPRVHGDLTGQEDSLHSSLAERGLRGLSVPAPADRPWDFDSIAETQRRLPRIAEMFPRRQYLGDRGTAS